MPKRLTDFLGRVRGKRLQLWGSLTILLFLLLCAGLVAALPSLLSTEAGQSLLRLSLKESLGRPVSWSKLSVSWSSGLTLRALSLGPGKPPLLWAKVGDAVVVPEGSYRDGRFSLDLKVRVTEVAAELAPGPPKPPPPAKEPLTLLAESLQKVQGMDWPLPLDVAFKVAVDRVNLTYGDPKTKRRIELKNASLQLDEPSLARSPVVAKLRGDLVVDGHRIEGIALDAGLKRLVTPGRRIRPAGALVTLEAALPGTSLDVQGGLWEPTGLKARARLDLSRLTSLAAPFLSQGVPELRGTLALDFKGKAERADRLAMELDIVGKGIAARGGRLGKRGLAPLNLKLRQKLVSDLKKKLVQFPDGSLTVDDWLAAAWLAEVRNPSDRDRELSARLGPVRVDLKRLMSAAAPLIPAKFPVRDLSGALTLRQVQLRLKGPRNEGEAKLDGLLLALPRLQVALSGGGFRGEGIELRLDRAALPLKEMKPTAAAAGLSYAVGRAEFAGKQPMKADGMRGTLQVTIKDLDLKSPSPRKFAADIQMSQVLDLNRIDLPPKLAGNRLREQLALHLLAKKDGEIEVLSPRVELSAAALSAAASDRQFHAAPLAATLTADGLRLPAAKDASPLLERVAATLTGELGVSQPKAGTSAGSNRTVDFQKALEKVPLKLTLSASGIRLPAKGSPLAVARTDCALRGEFDLAAGKPAPPGTVRSVAAPGKFPLSADLSASGIRLAAQPGGFPSVEKALCNVTGGDFLKLDGGATLSAASPQKITSDGTLRVDLDRMPPLVSSALPPGVAAGGVSTLSWNLALPADQNQPRAESKGAAKKAAKNPLLDAKAALARIDHADLTLSLANRRIRYPLSQGSVSFDDLRTGLPVRLQLSPGGNLKMEGDLAFAGLSGLPGSAGFPPQSGTLTLSAQLTNWQNLKLHEELKLKQFQFAQKADAAVGGIDLLMEKEASITPAALFQTLNAALSADLDARFPATPTAVPGGAKVSGALGANLRVDLAAGRDLGIDTAVRARDFGLRLENGTVVDGVHADVALNRNFALARKSAEGWIPLSASLVRPAPLPFASAGAAEIRNRVREDLQGQEHGSRRFTVRKVIVPGAKAPIELTSLEGDLLLTPETVGLSFFQADTLGGTVRLHGLIDLKPEVPALAAECSFTNLETLRLASAEARKLSAQRPQDTAITGELALAAPLATRERELLEGVKLRMSLRKIGADTLERALFSLDPYERNEQLVAQRKMLRMGSLKTLRAGTLDGAFSLEGEVRVKGVDLTLPRVERIRLSEIAQQKQLAGAVAAVKSVRKILDLARSDTLSVGPKGEISLERRGHEK